MVLVTAFSLTTQCKTLFSFMSWVLLEERITVSFFFVLSWVLLEEWITLSFVVNNGDEKMEVRWMGGSLQPCTNSITGHKGQRDAQFLKRLDLQTASIAANNGYDPFHIAAKQGHLGMMGSLQGPVACPSVHRKQVEVKSGPDGFMIKMRDGRYLNCAHNSPQDGHLRDYAPHPAIVLKMEDGTGLLLPIIVLEMPSVLLMAAIRNVQIARPTMYQVVQEMVNKMGYKVKLVRVTKRIHEAYFAQLYLAKVDDETECVSFDLRPSDAINIAVRCNVPIQVNKFLAYSDGVKIIESTKPSFQGSSLDGLIFKELDRPSGQPCVETKEFNLVRNMLVAAVEERYRDAAQWRDKLTQLRSKRNWA